MSMMTCPWYNCLAWAFSKVLNRELPCTAVRKFTLNHKKTINQAFIDKANEFDISVIKVDTFDELKKYQYGFLVYGFYTEEVRSGFITDYVDKGFHVVLYQDNTLLHQNGCGCFPTSTSMKELHKCGYQNPIYFAVVEKEQD